MYFKNIKFSSSNQYGTADIFVVCGPNAAAREMLLIWNNSWKLIWSVPYFVLNRGPHNGCNDIHSMAALYYAQSNIDCILFIFDAVSDFFSLCNFVEMINRLELRLRQLACLLIWGPVGARVRLVHPKSWFKNRFCQWPFQDCNPSHSR